MTGKTLIRNDLQCVDGDIKQYALSRLPTSSTRNPSMAMLAK